LGGVGCATHRRVGADETARLSEAVARLSSMVGLVLGVAIVLLVMVFFVVARLRAMGAALSAARADAADAKAEAAATRARLNERADEQVAWEAEHERSAAARARDVKAAILGRENEDSRAARRARETGRLQ